MGYAQGKLEFTPDISELSIRQRLSLFRTDYCCLIYFHYLALGTGSHVLSPKLQGDLDQSTLILTKELFLLPLPQDAPSFLNIVQIFYYLTLGLLCRVINSRQPDDVKCCIRYLHYLDGQWHNWHQLEVSKKCLDPVPISLVQALAVQVELEIGDVDHDIEEMASLCDELLNSDISIRSLTKPIADFARAIDFHHNDPLKWKIRSNKVTDCLQKAHLRLPSLHRVTLLLAQSLYHRFQVVVAPSNEDYKEGMKILDSIITFRDSGGEPSPYRERALEWAALFADARFIVHGKPEHLEHTIYCFRAWLDGTTIEDPGHVDIIYYLSKLEELRLNDTGNTRDALLVPPEYEKLPSFRELVASFPGPMDVKENSVTHMMQLVALASHVGRLTDAADIEDGIKYCRLLLVSYPGSNLASASQKALCFLLYHAFKCTHKVGYLNEAISSARNGINAVDSLDGRSALVHGLIEFLSTRLKLQRQGEDLHELMQLFPTAADHSLRGPYGRLEASFDWAAIARRFRHPSALTAYDRAMSLFQDSLTFAPTLDKQHSRLVATRGFHTIPLDYASFHISTGNMEQAIETLKRGRGLLWSEMRCYALTYL